MFPAAVHVKMPLGITVKHPPPTAVPLKPTGTVNVTIAFVPEMANTGPRTAFVPAAEASEPAEAALASPPAVLLKPGTQVKLSEEQSHCWPVLRLTQGV